MITTNVSKITTALSCLLLLAACKDFSGTTKVNTKITLMDGRKAVAIQPGSYSGNLKIKSKKKFTLNMKLPSGKASFVFKTDKNLKDLRSGDRISLSSRVNGQPYAVNGVYDVDHSSSDTQSGSESCTYTTSEYQCRDVESPDRCQTVTECDPANPAQCATRTVCRDGGSRTECGNVSVSHPGSRDVEYRYNTTTESVDLKLYDASQRVVATFYGSESDSNISYSYQGTCR